MTTLQERLAGRFIVVDGPDGGGKTTQLDLLDEYLRSCGVGTRRVRDPGGTAIGDRIREILLDRAHTEMAIGCEILLYMASRAQLMHQIIAPALQDGELVLCDRWVSATVAYQVAEGTATAEEVLTIYRLALREVWPDLTVVLDLPAETGLQRLQGPPDRMEAKNIDFHRTVRELFLAQAREQPGRFAVLDARGSIEDVQQRLRQRIEDWCATRDDG